MLQVIREKSQGWIATVILGLVCFSFALWGIHYYLTQSKSAKTIAKVGSIKITEDNFNQAVRQKQQQQKSELGTKYSNDEQFQNKLKKQVLTALINKQILINTLNKQGFYAGPEIVEQIILQIPTFQQSGKFSSKKFQQILTMMQTTPENFMAKLSDQVMAGQLEKGLVDSGFSLPDDVTKAVHLMKQTRDVGYIIIDPKKASKKEKITDNAMRAYYDNHKKQFTVPAKISLSYLLLSVDGLKEKQKINEKQIRNYYQTNQQQFKGKKLSQVREQIINILKRQAAEKVFASRSDNLANLTYENPTTLKTAAKALGLKIHATDFVAKGEKGNGILAQPKVVRIAFSNDVYEEGYNSDIIELSPSQQIVVRIKEKAPAKLLTFEQVKPQIVSKLKKQNQDKAAKEIANKMATVINAGQTGSEVAKQYGFKWHEKNDVNRHQSNVDPKVLLQVFQMQKPYDSKHPTTKVLSLPNGNYAMVALYQVDLGDPKKVSQVQKQAFKDVIGKKYGYVDYQLFLESIKNDAKIKQYISFNDIKN